ncbi:MAG: hypothetical protein ACF8MJ_13375 [Phycisphaerales bacterium JB050]
MSETGRLLTPLSVAGGLALAVGVWFMPLPDPSGPAPMDENYRMPSQGNGPTVVAIGKTGPHDWLALKDPFYELRDPVVIPPPPDDDRDPEPVRPPISVRYLGFVETSQDRVAALLDIEGTQRFVSVGQVVSIPNRSDLRVTEITPEKVVYEVGEASFTATRETRGDSPSTRTPGSQPASPMRPDMRPDEDRLRGIVPGGPPR